MTTDLAATESLFHPLIAEWFADRFGDPTDPQLQGWPAIAAGRHTLIAAPTGSGKTLAAFLVCLDRLVRRWEAGELTDAIEVVYISPLKALSNDIHRNLEVPLAEIADRAIAAGREPPPIRTMVRTGDTPASERQSMVRRPPHILVTTPESLYLLLTSEKGRGALRSVRTVIVDEIHALARDKRGSHLALSLERLAALTPEPPVRIGLSATQRPIDEIACFLVGNRHVSAAGAPDCQIVDVGHMRELELTLEAPASELAAVCSNEQWGEVYERLTELIQQHRSTLVFVNTRRMAERIAHHLTEALGEEAVASHHGSLSRELRHSAEQRLKSGELKAIVATASLEMGIDVGYIDLVCQIGSPRSIATFLQRVGRSGHSLGLIPRGRLFPLTRDELIECLSLVRAVRRGELDRIEIPVHPLDILAQQIIASVAGEEWDEEDLFNMVRNAWPYRHLKRSDFDRVIHIASEGVAKGVRHGAWLHRDGIGGRLRARRGARLAAITSGGAIPETAEYRVVTEEERTLIGKVDEDFAIESLAGDVFLLGNNSWRIRQVRGGEVVVQDAGGAPPSIPFWFGEAPGRTIELSHQVSGIREQIAAEMNDVAREPESSQTYRRAALQVARWLVAECGATPWAAHQAIRYVVAQQACTGLVPTARRIVFERFFDESGGMQLVIHAPLGARINRAWGLALRKRFCRSFDFELQAAADDDGIVLSLGPQHSFPIENLFRMLTAENAEYLLTQALLAVPMFQVRWRWNVTRALAVLRNQAGKKVPPHLQRFRSDDLLASVFPETVGCLENHHGDVEIPDHPLVQQTMHDCLHEAMDLNRWIDLLRDVTAGKVELVARDTREPSPFSHELLNANPYAFLDGAPLEERRTRAIHTRRTLSPQELGDLAQLDPAAILLVRREAWPLVRDVDELHDALLQFVAVESSAVPDWRERFQKLCAAGRAAEVRRPGQEPLWIAAERWPVLRAAFPDASAAPDPKLPAELQVEMERSTAWVELVRGRIQFCGPTTAAELAGQLGLEISQAAAALEALEGQGVAMRGRFTAASQGAGAAQGDDQGVEIEWCDRRLLARIHRLTLDGLRKQIRPVEPADYLRYLARHHRLLPGVKWSGPAALRETLAQLQGFELPAGAWESLILSPRMSDYDPDWLDQLFLTGEAVWGRLRPPRRDAEERPTMAAISRAMPMSLLMREDLPWLLPRERAPAHELAGGNAQAVLQVLTNRGALFFPDLQSRTGLLPAQLEDALRELAALGLITSDMFAAVRAIAKGREKSNGRRYRRARAVGKGTTIAGRWSLFPGDAETPEPEQYRERWCRLLIARYGVVFRDLLTRESAAPPWWELAPVYRRLERRGELRGGRFVAGVGGEQFGNEATVELLRAERDREPATDWIVINAVDPLNLSGIVTSTARIAARHGNALILRQGEVAAAMISRRVEFFTELDQATQVEMTRALRIGRRLSEPEVAAREERFLRRRI